MKEINDYNIFKDKFNEIINNNIINGIKYNIFKNLTNNLVFLLL